MGIRMRLLGAYRKVVLVAWTIEVEAGVPGGDVCARVGFTSEETPMACADWLALTSFQARGCTR